MLAFAASAATSLLVIGTALRIVRVVWTDLTAEDAAIRVGVTATGLVVATMMLLGALRALTPGRVLLAHAAVAAASGLLGRRTRWRRPAAAALDPSMAAPIGAIGALLAFAVAFAVSRAPFTLYDSLSYHLFFAGRWVQDRAISIIPTPFSDVAQAYAPANGELFLAWLMLPLHSDAIARMGQLPFAIFAAAALYAIARRLGAEPAKAIYPAAFLLFARPIVEQMIGANVDLICAALFLASVYLIVIAVDRDRRRDWVLCGVSVGLYCGTKYLALVYVPVLVALACARGLPRRLVWAAPGIAAFAMPWYVRNWMVAGSPIYPSSLTIAGIMVARGAFSRAAMFNTVFHSTDVTLFPAMAAHAIGPTLFVLWLPCALLGWLVMARRGWWPHGALAVMPLAMVPLYWFGVPINIDSRFLMPAVGPALLPLAFLFRRSRRWNAAVHVAYAAGLAWLVIGSNRSLPGTLPWFMSGWLSLQGLVAPPFVMWYLVSALILAAIWTLTTRTRQRTVPLLTVATAGIAAALVWAGPRRCGPEGCEYLQPTSPFIRAGYLDSWRWLNANIHDATVAYTGINLPYPLSGRDLTNRVMYVNIDGRARWRFHDYDRAYRTGRFAPTPPFLATSSGELRPVVNRTGPRDDAVRPRYDRMEGIRDAWIFNLQSMRVQYLFVAMLSAYEIDYVWHNEGGFPIEDDWAAHDLARFHLVYANPQVHIYAIDRAAKAQA